MLRCLLAEPVPMALVLTDQLCLWWRQLAPKAWGEGLQGMTEATPATAEQQQECVGQAERMPGPGLRYRGER